MDSAVERERAKDAAQPPQGRYGRTAEEADARTDRRLKTLGAVLGVLLLGVVGWFGYDYVTGQRISGEVIKFQAVSDRSVEVHLEVRKDAGTDGYCTLRSRSADGAEVGRADFRFDQDRDRIDKVVTLRTTARGTSAELVGCHTG
ncbi:MULTISPECIES: DUF4307 domain-containing protein [Streptomyces]|uniref:DUF4307 domain-containing protein n=1 Tax=Streptomyces albus (strain ATCC 21838 / DSM 41398 / FERM P-419 / JCM 4703 / NBRC 107858) TaxID=1081613 RepID=A0A0B5EU64_STRA4|nr:DUF4307 domain-containing protein [Streptomyces sp. SCSIO ZS0520]AJE85264.1 hypothetical protein SLNWT_4888 [Streptomyces albus]AOU79571.1 hypothetical protein SLNHY_4880 [Streptomyces albus]AYN35294.1 DUF4307 domain-containing protein [Streptomyces albus]